MTWSRGIKNVQTSKKKKNPGRRTWNWKYQPKDAFTHTVNSAVVPIPYAANERTFDSLTGIILIMIIINVITCVRAHTISCICCRRVTFDVSNFSYGYSWQILHTFGKMSHYNYRTAEWQWHSDGCGWGVKKTGKLSLCGPCVIRLTILLCASSKINQLNFEWQSNGFVSWCSSWWVLCIDWWTMGLEIDALWLFAVHWRCQRFLIEVYCYLVPSDTGHVSQISNRQNAPNLISWDLWVSLIFWLSSHWCEQLQFFDISNDS